jgi:hypothetical protein
MSYTCPIPGPGFPTSCVVVFFCVQLTMVQFLQYWGERSFVENVENRNFFYIMDIFLENSLL